MIEDTELDYWRTIYPDAYRNCDGNIVTERKWNFLLDKKPDPNLHPQASKKPPSILKKGFFINPPIHRPPREKGEKGRISDTQRLDDAEWNFEVPGAELSLHPIRKGKEGWDIKNLVQGRDITYSWGCGCELYIDAHGDENYKFCGKDEGECERPSE